MADNTDLQQSNTQQPAGGLDSVAVPIKVTQGSRGMLPTISSAGTLLDEESSKSTLANMQKMLDEYNDPMKKFQDNLQKAHAWTLYNKEPAFRNIQEQEAQEQANKYNLMQNMIALKSSQTMAQNTAQSLLSPDAGGTGHQYSATNTFGNPTGDKVVDDATQAEINRLILKDRNIVGAQKLREKAFADYLDASNRNKFSVDWDAPVPGVIVNGVEKPVSRRVFAQMMKTDPDLAKYNPSMAQQVSGGVPGVVPLSQRSPKDLAAEIEKDFGIKLGPAALERTRDQQQELVDRFKAGDKGVYMPESVVEGKDAYHTGAIDVPTNVPESYLNARGYERKLGAKDPVHATPIAGFGQPAASVTAPTAGITPPANQPRSVAEINAALKNKGDFNSAFLESTYKPLAAKVAAEEEDTRLAKQVLGSLNNNKFGPGASIDQALSKGLQTIGIKGSPEEQAAFLDNINIEQARKLLSTSTMRSALGPQFTENENKAYTELTPGIDSPKELLKQYYQFRIANAEINKDRKRYLEQHPDNVVQADADWEKSGARERILKQYAPIYDKIQKRAAELDKGDNKTTNATTKPAGAPSDARLGKDANGNPGWFVVRNGKTLQWKP